VILIDLNVLLCYVEGKTLIAVKCSTNSLDALPERRAVCRSLLVPVLGLKEAATGQSTRAIFSCPASATANESHVVSFLVNRSESGQPQFAAALTQALIASGARSSHLLVALDG
jgi:hypothetical protein